MSLKKEDQKFEAFFKLNWDFIYQTVNEKHEWHTNTQCSKRDYNRFFKFVDFVQVSTEFDNREMRCANYAGIMDETSIPLLIINFKNKLAHDLNFYTQWFNPKGKGNWILTRE
jgi:hypothetical protein